MTGKRIMRRIADAGYVRDGPGEAGYANGMSDVLVAILGAGRADRFGSPKLDAILDGRPLGRASVRTALALGFPTVFIAGANLPRFLSGMDERGLSVVVNPAAAEGMGTSLALAARTARLAGADRLLVLLADMPFVTIGTLEALLAASVGVPAAACRYPDGGLGPPACFPASAYARLEALTGDVGARRLLRELSGAAVLDVGEAELVDIDTPADLVRSGGGAPSAG